MQRFWIAIFLGLKMSLLDSSSTVIIMVLQGDESVQLIWISSQGASIH